MATQMHETTALYICIGILIYKKAVALWILSFYCLSHIHNSSQFSCKGNVLKWMSDKVKITLKAIINLIISYHIIILYETFGHVSFQMKGLCFMLKALSTG